MTSADQDTDAAQLPEDLPPVEPPSAGFIIQLFVVPGLIVVAIVGVYLLFGKLASGEQDWQSLLVELKHPNEHRRWRGALGLGQVLNADQKMGVRGHHLSRNREIAQSLADVLASELKRGGQNEPDLKYQAYLARTLGLFDLPEIVLPPLEQAMHSGNDREVRKNALSSIAVMADRFSTAKNRLTFPGLSNELVAVSRDDDPLIRQLSAFTLGLFSDSEAKDRLEVMLGDSDADTRINAAIGLARQGDSRGASVFKEVLTNAARPAEAEAVDEVEHFLAIKNCIQAIVRVAPAFNPQERTELVTLLEPLAAGYREPKIRIEAKNAMVVLRDQPQK